MAELAGEISLGLIGVGILVVTMLDALRTTLGTGGAGPLSGLISRGLWRSALAAHHRRPSHRLLSRVGPVMLVLIVGLWIVLLWLGYFCLFSVEPQDIVHAQSQRPADAVTRLYFTGYTIFTLGIGDIIPYSGPYRVLTALASVNGLVLITLSITYLIPVLSAATMKRQLAALIRNLGRTPQEVLVQGWDGRGFGGLCTALERLEPMIELHAQRHLAYPVLHYFHSARPREALGRQLAVLDEALLLLEAGVAPEVAPPPVCVGPVRQSVDGFLDIIGQRFIEASEHAPPAPALEPLREAGIPAADEASVREAAQRREKHRRVLQAFVKDQGWSWRDVVETK